MLTQSDFVSMLTDLQVQMVTTIKTIQTLTNEIEDKELRYQFVAMAQSKQRHLEAMNALASLVKGGVSSLTAVAPK
jgi:hypothetical protein